MKEQSRGKLMAAGAALCACLFALDQATKRMAAAGLKDKPSIPVIDHVFELSYVENRGAAFGILQNQKWLFVVLTVVVAAGVGWLFWKMPPEKRYLPARGCFSILMAGALGNLADRIRLGYVVDFFYFKLIDFPVFNMADIYVVASVVLMALLVLFYYREEELEAAIRR